MSIREFFKLKYILIVCAVVGVGCHPKKKPRNPIVKDKPEEVVLPGNDPVEPDISEPSPTPDTPPARLKSCENYKSGAVVCDHEWVGEAPIRTIIAIHGMFPGNPRQLVRGVFGTDNEVRAFANRYRARIVVLGRPKSLILWSYKDHLQDIVNIGRIYGEQSELYFFGHSNGGGLAGCAAAAIWLISIAKAIIFNPEMKTSRTGTSGETGTGFGMPLVKAFVETVKGSIEIRSKAIKDHPKDHGTTVVLTFRRSSQETSTVEEAS